MRASARPTRTATHTNQGIFHIRLGPIYLRRGPAGQGRSGSPGRMGGELFHCHAVRAEMWASADNEAAKWKPIGIHLEGDLARGVGTRSFRVHRESRWGIGGNLLRCFCKGHRAQEMVRSPKCKCCHSEAAAISILFGRQRNRRHYFVIRFCLIALPMTDISPV
jgi:hypothetical protein